MWLSTTQLLNQNGTDFKYQILPWNSRESFWAGRGKSETFTVCLCIAGRGKAGKKGGKVQGEKLSLVGINHWALTRDEGSNLLFFLFSYSLNHATHSLPCVPSSLISVSQAVQLHSPGKVPDIWRGVKSTVLSVFLLKSWKLTLKYLMLNMP